MFLQKKKILQLAKGFRGRAKNCVHLAIRRVEKALQYATRDRAQKKREMRSLWITRINAGAREHGVSVPLLDKFYPWVGVVPLATVQDEGISNKAGGNQFLPTPMNSPSHAAL